MHTSHQCPGTLLHACIPVICSTLVSRRRAKHCTEVLSSSSSRLRQLIPPLELQEAVSALDVDDCSPDLVNIETIITLGVSEIENDQAAAVPSAALPASTAFATGYQAATLAQSSSDSSITRDWTVSDDADIQSAELQLGLWDLAAAGNSVAATTAAPRAAAAGIEGSSALTTQLPGKQIIPHELVGTYLQDAPRQRQQQLQQQQQQQQLLQKFAGSSQDTNSNNIISSSSKKDVRASKAPQLSESIGTLAPPAAATGEVDEPSADTTEVVTAAAAAATAEAAGSFFSSRSHMLQQLQHQQRLMQRQHLLQKQRRSLYTYTLSGTGDIAKLPPPGPKSPLQQDVFPLAKRPPQQQPGAATAASAAAGMQSVTSVPVKAGSGQSSGSKSRLGDQGAPQQQQQQQQQQLQQLQQLYPFQEDDFMPELEVHTRAYQYSSSSSGKSSTGSIGSTGIGSTSDLSRGLCLSAFLYCCSRTKLLSLTWQLGLPPAALVFVPRVADADLVLHVKPGRGERHYEYDEYRAQAAAKGIPFVDLKNLSLAELRLYLLPVYKLYAGEVSPRELLLRKKPRGRRKHYTNIKLPPA